MVTRRRGRPLSPESLAVLEALVEPMPARRIAAAVMLSATHADQIAHRLTSRGYLLEHGTEPARGRGPVIVYARNPEAVT